ncbi:hypothetical protein CPC08DRAFT_761341 [Agrocybe pediades]|nr:hypothetical protein CPC08DRAFT_761341 [Agrocybe pediades]
MSISPNLRPAKILTTSIHGEADQWSLPPNPNLEIPAGISYSCPSEPPSPSLSRRYCRCCFCGDSFWEEQYGRAVQAEAKMRAEFNKLELEVWRVQGAPRCEKNWDAALKRRAHSAEAQLKQEHNTKLQGHIEELNNSLATSRKKLREEEREHRELTRNYKGLERKYKELDLKALLTQYENEHDDNYRSPSWF